MNLPINLLNFEAKRQDKAILLNWVTASEKDNAGFEIEKSINAINFESIAFVEGAGNSNEVKHYQYSMVNSEASFYRLKQLDFDKSFSYSLIIFINALDADLEPILYPNPTSGELHIGNISDLEVLTVNIFGTRGKKLSTLQGNKLEIENKIGQRLKSLEEGVYIIRLQTFDKTYHRKIIKK